MRKLLIPLAISVVLVGIVFWLLSGTSDLSHTDPMVTSTTEDEARSSESASVLEGYSTPASTQTPDSPTDPESDAVVLDGALLHGVVTNDSGDPLPEATVFLTTDTRSMFRDDWQRTMAMRERILGRGPSVSMTGAAVAETTTDNDGKYAFAIESLPRQSYYVIARHAEFAPMREAWKWAPQTTEIDFHLVVGDSITGVVRNPEGQPVVAAIVEAYDERGRGGRFGRGGTVSDRTETDGDGQFRLNVPAGVYRVRADADTHDADSQSGVAAGTEDVSLTLDTLGGLKGRVVDEVGQPVPEVKVSFLDGDWGRGRGGGALTSRWFGRAEAEATTDTEGLFQLVNVPFGSYTLIAEKSGFVVASTAGRTSREEAPGQLELTLRRAAVLTGTVSDPTGNPVAGAYVAVGPDREERGGFRRGRGDRGGGDRRGRGGRGREDREGRGRDGTESNRDESAEEAAPPTPEPVSSFGTIAGVETDQSGKFHFDTLPPGKYALSVQTDQFVTYRQDELDLKEPQDLTITLDSGSTITGRVLSSADDSALKNAKVFVRMGDRDRHQVTTDEDGHFSIGGLSPGRVREARVQAEGFTQGFFEDLVIPEGENLKHDFRLDPSGSITGVVTNKQGQPLFHARVSLNAPPPDWREEGFDFGRFRQVMMRTKRATTDGAGRFRLDDVDAGVNYSLRVEHTEHLPQTFDEVQLAPGETIKEVELALSSGARVEVHVRGPDGPVAKARVMILQKPEPEVEAASDGNERGDGEESGRRRFRGRGGGFGGFGRGFGGTSRRVYTGPDGKAAFSGLTDGTYFVSTTADRLQPALEETVAVVDQTATVVLQLPSENTIAGVIQDSRGNPVPGAEVEAYRYADAVDEKYKDLDEITRRRLRDDSEARSDESGRFRVGSLGEGMYTVRIRARGYAEQRLEGVETNRDINVTLEQYGSIQGWVLTAETGQPVPAFEIRLRTATGEESGENAERTPGGQGRERGGDFRRGGGRGRGRGGFDRGRGGRRDFRDYWRFDDEGGEFTMDPLPPGRYRMYVTAEGHTGTETQVTVRDGEMTRGIRVELEEGLAATGVVIRDGGTEPIAGAKVYLLALQSREREGPDGGDRRALQRLEDRRDARRDLQREARRLSSQVSQLTRAAAIKEAIDAEATARKAGGPATESDADGMFKIADIEPGNYAVVVSHANFLPVRETLRVSSRRVIPELRIRLDPGEKLQGKITLGNRSPGAELTVILRDPTNGYSKRVQSSANGEYTVTGLYPGEFTLKVSGPLEIESEPAQVVIKDGDNRFNYRLGGP